MSHAVPEISSGTTPSTEREDYYADGSVPWVNTGDLNDGILKDCAKNVTPLAINDHTTLKPALFIESGRDWLRAPESAVDSSC